ncbi:unnamed protein product [Scytosiphon promiscuus]
MSGTSKRRGEDLQPPELRRKLNDGGVGQVRCSNTAAVARPRLEHRQARATSYREMLKWSVQDTMDKAQATVAVADMLCKETDKYNQALEEENVVLRACSAELLDDETVKERSDSIPQLLRVARDFRRAQKQKEQGLTAALSKAEAAMRRERSMRLETQLEMQACRAVNVLQSRELKRERDRREDDKVTCTTAINLIEAYRAAHAALTKSSDKHRNAEIATSIALAGEKRRVEKIREQRQHYKDLVVSALRELRGEGTRRETAVGEPEQQHEASLKSALKGLKKERAARKGEAQASASAARTARHALAEERARREAAEDGARCVICMSHTRNTMLLPCSHLVLCDKCPRVSECPICRARVRRTMHVILS